MATKKILRIFHAILEVSFYPRFINLHDPCWPYEMRQFFNQLFFSLLFRPQLSQKGIHILPSGYRIHQIAFMRLNQG